MAMKPSTHLIYKDESYEIVGACMEIHRELGHGFLEAVYHEALAIEFALRAIPFIPEAALDVTYKNQVLEKQYFADFVCYEKIIVELKAITQFNNDHIGQVLNYLKSTRYKLGILVNFGTSELEYKRIVR